MEQIEFGSKVRVRLDPQTMDIRLETAFGRYASRAEFRPYFIDMEGERVPFSAAEQRSAVRWDCGTGSAARVRLGGFRTEKKRYALEILLQIEVLEQTGEVLFELIPLREAYGEVKKICWPQPLYVCGEERARGFTAMPMMQGMLIPDDCPDELHPFLSTRVCSTECVLPFWGSYRESGFLAIIESYADACLDYHHLPYQPARLSVQWEHSMGTIGYRRTLRVQLFETCDHVRLAKAFRAWTRSVEGLVTLEEKAIRSEKVRQLIGSAVVNTPPVLFHCEPVSSYFNKTDPAKNHEIHSFDEIAAGVEKLRTRGLDRAYFHIDGWGKMGYDNLHPDVTPPCPEAGGAEAMRRMLDTMRRCGYLSGLHDQYRDYYLKAESFDEDNAIRNFDGSFYRNDEWPGGEERALCTMLAPDYIRRNYARLSEAGIEPDGAYLDCFSGIELEECYNPMHRMTRRECAQKRNECFELVRSQGRIVSSEEGCYPYVNHLDLLHHAPYVYAFMRVAGVDTPNLIPVPLFSLVYHECIVIPWSMGCRGWGTPERDCGGLHGMLNGGVTMLEFDPCEAELRMSQDLTRLNRTVWNREMTGHRFVGEGTSRQQSRFADGTVVTVDFAENWYKIELSGGETLCGQGLPYEKNAE